MLTCCSSQHRPLITDDGDVSVDSPPSPDACQAQVEAALKGMEEAGTQLKKAWRALIASYSLKASPLNFPLWVRQKLDDDDLVLACLHAEFGKNALDGMYNKVTHRIQAKISAQLGLHDTRLLALWFGTDPIRTPTRDSLRIIRSHLNEARGDDESDIVRLWDEEYGHIIAQWAARNGFNANRPRDRVRCVFARLPFKDLEPRPRTRLSPKDFTFASQTQEGTESLGESNATDDEAFGSSSQHQPPLDLNSAIWPVTPAGDQSGPAVGFSSPWINPSAAENVVVLEGQPSTPAAEADPVVRNFPLLPVGEMNLVESLTGSREATLTTAMASSLLPAPTSPSQLMSTDNITLSARSILETTQASVEVGWSEFSLQELEVIPPSSIDEPNSSPPSPRAKRRAEPSLESPTVKKARANNMAAAYDETSASVVARMSSLVRASKPIVVDQMPTSQEDTRRSMIEILESETGWVDSYTMSHFLSMVTTLCRNYANISLPSECDMASAESAAGYGLEVAKTTDGTIGSHVIGEQDERH